MATINDITTTVSLYYAGVDTVTPAESTISLAVISAIDAINEIREYVNTEDATDVLEDKYRSRAVRIAIYLCDKEGITGVKSFTDNMVTRTYGNCDIPNELLAGISPICKAY